MKKLIKISTGRGVARRTLCTTPEFYKGAEAIVDKTQNATELEMALAEKIVDGKEDVESESDDDADDESERTE